MYGAAWVLAASRNTSSAALSPYSCRGSKSLASRKLCKKRTRTRSAEHLAWRITATRLRLPFNVASVRFVPVYHPTLHHEHRILERGDIFRRIAAYAHDVGELANLDSSNPA